MTLFGDCENSVAAALQRRDKEKHLEDRDREEIRYRERKKERKNTKEVIIS